MKTLMKLATDIALSLIPPAAVFVLHVCRVIFLPRFYEGDMIMHFSGGVAIAWMGLILWNRFTSHGWIPNNNPWWLRDITIWGGVALAGVFWEFMETWSDMRGGTRMQFSIRETMGDLFLDLSGGLLFIAIYTIFRLFSQKPKAHS